MLNGLKDSVSGILWFENAPDIKHKESKLFRILFFFENRRYFLLLRFCFSHHLGLNIKFTANVEIKLSSTIASVVRAAAWPLSVSFVGEIFWKQVLNLNHRQQKSCKYHRFVWKGGHHTISLKYPDRDGWSFAIKTCEGDDNFVTLSNEIN